MLLGLHAFRIKFDLILDTFFSLFYIVYFTLELFLRHRDLLLGDN